MIFHHGSLRPTSREDLQQQKYVIYKFNPVSAGAEL
jgi:hypothetical protein